MGLYEGETLLYFMIAQCDVNMVKWLCDKGARSHHSTACACPMPVNTSFSSISPSALCAPAM